MELSGQLADGAAVQARWAGSAAGLDGIGTGEPGSWRAEVDVGADWGWFALEAEGSTPVLTATLTRRGWHYVPPAAEDITHDADGNLTADARWTCKWDAENRLIGMTEKAGIPVHSGGIPAAVLAPPARRQITFGYDAEGRRIAKVVREWDAAANGGAFSTLVKDQRFLYDGWNMTVELDHTFATAGSGLAGIITAGITRRYENRAHTLEHSDTLLPGSWLPVPGLNPIYGTSGSGTWQFPIPAADARFYCLRVTKDRGQGGCQAGRLLPQPP